MRASLILLALLIVASCSPRLATVSPGSPLATITVVATADLHGRLEALPWLGGYLRVLRDMRARQGGVVLLVDAGDMWQGTLTSNMTEGATAVRAYNALGYTAVAIGNHEFDFGPVGPHPVARTPEEEPRGAFEARAGEARFPFLAANVTGATGRPWAPANVKPSHLVLTDGVKVGLVGVTTTTTPEVTDVRNLVSLRFAPLAEAVVAAATRLRREGAAVVIVVAHAGGRCEAWNDPLDLSSCDAAEEVFVLANALPRGLVDVIAAGNTHQGIAHRVNGIAVVQPFSAGRAFGRVDLLVQRATGALRDVRIYPPRLLCGAVLAQSVSEPVADTCAPAPYEGQEVTPDADLDRLIRPDLERARAIRERSLGVTAPRHFWNSFTGESPAGNLVVDLLRASKPDSDVAIYHAGGTRSGLDPGPITYGAIYDLVPFDSTPATATVSAGELAEAIARGLTRNIFPTVSGIRVIASCHGTTPHVALFRAEREIRPDERLSIVTSEYLVAGGALVFGGMRPVFTIEASESMRDAVVRVLPATRVEIETGVLGSFDDTRPRIVIPGALPLHCIG